MFNCLYSYLEKYDSFTKYQYGIRKKSSTVYTICSIYDRLIKNIDDGLYTCCIFLDLTNALDTVDHAKLLNKMHYTFVMRGIANQLLESYLSDRKQYTKVLYHKSKTAKITHGIPQGSSLGPLLFLLYVNDLPLASEFETTLFADDTYLAISDKCITDLERKVNKELIKIDRRLKINKLSLNISKSCYMLTNNQPNKSCTLNLQLSLNSVSLTRQQTVKYLGVLIDDNLKLSIHIHHLSIQLSHYSGVFCRIRNLIPIKVSKMLYFCFIYSRIQYGIVIWGNASKIYLKELSVRLNNIIRSITFSKKCSHVTNLYKNLNLLQLNDIYKLELARFMYQLHNGTLPKSFYDRFIKLSAIHLFNQTKTKFGVFQTSNQKSNWKKNVNS